MTIPFNSLRARIRVPNIVSNYRRLCRPGGETIPVIKADAYGHGLVPVARALSKAGAATFAVGSVEEAVALRASGVPGRILSLLGPIDADQCQALWRGDVIPFVHHPDQLRLLADVSRNMDRPLGVALKCDTGMRRLGFTRGDAAEAARIIAATPGLNLAMLSSHLATADDPGDFDYVEAQIQEFTAIRGQLLALGLSFQTNLANSAAVLAHPEAHFDSRRVGISLYGGNPFQGTPLAHLGQGLVPAMEVATRIVSVHDLAAGQSVSYGRTFTAPTDTRIAVVAAGYADAYGRSLSNSGFMYLRGVRVPIRGRVCMQLTAVEVSEVPDVRPGEEILLLGGQGENAITPDDLAEWWGTISYEVLCLLGLNPREYVE
ncbi:alanine racemase [Desulfolutivibrio sulfoxidireducens]|uniref:alanine racemase n=1 Tax=Desulfolutivibrio sulfoxidireducens TaxID=2773299 RepID=UPI00159DE8F8|nr:alanine racemase [Desulfolutivibrio sulfoxidireducens]QLA16291.1 alanine racemase [Desulfolutivibrio sulfoxidireducens]QLA19817.1 alanine racemase [Desulfolutivibrio sulfoxidireducens]